MYTYLAIIVFLVISMVPQLLAVWYFNWEKKQIITEQFVKNMISAIDEILTQKKLQEKIDQFVKVGFSTPTVIGIGKNDVDYYDGVDNYTLADEEEISDFDFFAESLESEIERIVWSGVLDRHGITRFNGTIKCAYQLDHDGKFVSHNKPYFGRSQSKRGNKPKTHK